MRQLLDKYKAMSPVAKAPIWYAICSVIQYGISFITLPIFTGIMSTEQYGMFTIYQSWMPILVIFTTLNLHYGVLNNAMVKYEDKRDEFISAMMGLIITMNLIFFAVFWLLRGYVSEIFGLPVCVIVAMFVEMTLTPAFGFWSGKKRFEYRYREVIVFTLVLATISPIVGVIVVNNTENKGVTKIIANVVVLAALYGALTIFLIARGKKLYVKEYWKYALSFGIPLIPYYLSQMIFNQSDRIMIDKMVGKDKAAIYGVVYGCAIVINFAITSINNAFVPWTYERLKDKNYKKLSQVAMTLLAFIGGVLVMVMLVSPEIIRIMAADEYYEGVWIMPTITCSLFFLFVSQLFINVVFYYEKKDFLVWGSVLAAVVNVVLNYVLIQIYGYLAAGYTTLIAYIIFAICNYFFMKKLNHGQEKIYNTKMIVGLSGLMIIMTLVITFLYHYFIIRYVVLATIIVACILLREKILGIIRTIKE